MNKKTNNGKEKKLTHQTIEKIEKILESHKRPYEKKLALFNIIKSLELEELPNEEERVNYLLESCLLSELSRQSLKEYKKITAESFSKAK
jgi:hypothetical protein